MYVTKIVGGYYFITDSALSRRGNISDVKDAVASGVSVVQYREKCASAKDMFSEAVILRRICKDIIFLVNDRVDIALSSGADGVHIGGEDMPYDAARRLLGKNRIIGVTAHNVREAVRAQEAGADYLSAAPIFKTATKPDAGRPAGIKLIRDIKRRVNIPVVAIGGINLFNARQVIAAGADGLCAISAVVASGDIKRKIMQFQKLFDERR